MSKLEKEAQVNQWLRQIFAGHEELLDNIEFIKKRVGYKTEIEQNMINAYESQRKSVSEFIATCDRLNTDDKSYVTLMIILLKTIVFGQTLGQKEIIEIISKTEAIVLPIKKDR